MSALPPVFIEFLGRSTGVKTAIKGVQTELATVDAEGAGAFAKTGMLGKAAILGLGVAAVETAKKTVEMAGDFEQQMTRVRTGAGEAASNMKLVSQGVLAMAGQVGQSTTELTAGLYMVESAGYHGADALNVLKTAAQGAKVGNADLKTTTDAVTTAMNAYKLGAGSVTQVMNALIGTEAEGKTNLEDLAGSMSTILPTAAAAHVGLQEVLGAMATMTAQGTPAKNAATYLRQTIGQLSNPSAKAADEMKNLGLSAVQLGQELGKKGLAATLTTITTAIEQHMGPAGTVLIKHLQGAAKNTTAFQKVLANLPPSQQTYVGALATMVGGTKSMQAALELTGPHMADFQDKTKSIGEHVKAGGKQVEGWSDVQKNFNQRVDEAKASLQAMGIQVGQVLMPYVQKLVGWLAQSASWLAAHSTAAKVAAGIIGGVLVFALATATAWLYEMAVAAATNPMVWIVLGVMALVAAIVLLITHWRQVWGAIKDISKSVAQAVVGAWDAVRDETLSIWGDITSALSTAWNAVAGFFSSAWHRATDPIVAGWRFLWTSTVAIWDGITGFFKKWWPLLLVIFLPFVAIVISIWNHFHQQITSTVTAVWNAVSGFLSTVWGGIKTAAGLVWAAIRLTILDPMLSVWHGLQSLWKTVSGWLGTAWRGIRNVASSIWSQIKSAMTGPFTSAWHTITTTVDHIKNAIQTGLDQAWTAVSSIGNEFEQIGQDIINGIVQGVQDAAGSLFSAVGDVAHGALNAAKSFLGINSPSKEFADQVGSAIPEGIAKGALDNARLAHAAVRSLSAGLPAAASLAGGASLALGLGAGGGATVIHQHLHVTVQGHVMTDRQLVDVVQAGFGELGSQNPVTWQSYKR